jgi:putative nucleotidyltransferase with HDIG domain
MTIALRAASALKNLAPFPQVASKVISLLGDDSVSFREIADSLNRDAALSAEVLRLANSPLYGPRYGVSNILHALAVLGVKRLTGLVLTLSMSKFLKRAGAKDAMQRSWRHNLACALAAKEFAHSFGEDASEAYNAGLFHDVGRLAFLTVDPKFYQGLTGSVDNLSELELAHFGVDHCEAGAWVIEKWQLPRTFVEVARHHHAPQPEGGELTMLVNSACVVANQLGFSFLPVDASEIDLDSNDELSCSIVDFITSLEQEYDI